MRRGVVIVPLLMALAACADVPSDGAIEQAAAKVSAAPVPAGSSERVSLDEQPTAERVGDTNTFRIELCSDGSCPLVVRGFEPVDYPSLDEACAAVDAYVLAVGGSATLASCPPTDVGGSASTSGDRGAVSDVGSVVVPDGEFGNTVVFTLSYTADLAGAWIPGTEATAGLVIGQQFCSDNAIAQACTSD